MTLRFGYVTNGLGDHRLEDALCLLADHGYQGVGVTLDHHHLDPFAPDLHVRLARLARLLDRLGLAVVIETGARFALDPRRKHEPSLLSGGRDRRLDLLERAIDIAAELGAAAVSFFSGALPPSLSEKAAWVRLVDGCSRLLDRAERRHVVLGLEPEPGMLVERLDDYDELAARLSTPPRLRITLDLGHCLCVEDQAPELCLRRAAPRLANVHIEDMRRGVHEHLDFGDGELDVRSALRALEAAGYRGLVCVELPRHAHLAHVTVPRSIRLLRSALSPELSKEASA